MSVVGLLLLSGVLTTAEVSNSTPIQLGGVRKVSGTVVENNSEYVVNVMMLPVKSFDEGTNSRLNRTKGRNFGLQILLKHLYGDKSKQSASFSGISLEAAAMKGKFYTLSLKVPRDGVRLTDNQSSAVAKKVESKAVSVLTAVSASSSLLTRKADYLSTLAELMSHLSDDAGEASRSHSDEAEAFFETVADLEERCEAEVGELLSEVKKDRLLLSDEAKEIELPCSKASEQFKDKLRSLVVEVESKSSKENTE